MKYLFALFCIGTFFNCREHTVATTGKGINRVDTLQDTIKLPDTLTITAVGDMMIGSAYPSKTNLPKNPENSFKNVQQFLTGDVVFGNLEGCFLDSGRSTKCKDPKSTSCYAFRQPERYVDIYKAAGFNVVSLANNHVGDFGWKGRNKTIELLDRDSINYGGLIKHPYSIFMKNGVKYGFCAFAPNEFTLPINNLDSATNIVRELKSQVDIVIVSFHGGAEGAKFEHVPRKNEIFYQENRGNVYKFAHSVIDAGADIVLGNGPHVTRAAELYKNRFIAYSLGNFCTYGMFSLAGPAGIAPLVNVKLNSKGEFLYADVVSVNQTKLSGLEIDKTTAAFQKMKYLTKTDFPQSDLIFTADNRIEIKPR